MTMKRRLFIRAVAKVIKTISFIANLIQLIEFGLKHRDFVLSLIDSLPW
jgi:methionine synthase I (cobalamin-dependent)